MQKDSRFTIEQDLRRITGDWTKADKARRLLELGYGVSEISKAVPMAYSQVHSIASKRTLQEVSVAVGTRRLRDRKADIDQLREGHRAYNKANNIPEPVVVRAKTTVKAARAIQADVDRILTRERQNETAGRPAGTGAKPRVGKLRTGNLPHDIDVGPCANCGHDLVVRRSPHGFMLVHVNSTAEEYLATIQFCQAVPERLAK